MTHYEYVAEPVTLLETVYTVKWVTELIVHRSWQEVKNRKKIQISWNCNIFSKYLQTFQISEKILTFLSVPTERLMRQKKNPYAICWKIEDVQWFRLRYWLLICWTKTAVQLRPIKRAFGFVLLTLEPLVRQSFFWIFFFYLVAENVRWRVKKTPEKPKLTS